MKKTGQKNLIFFFHGDNGALKGRKSQVILQWIK